jgi:phage shock protein A
MMEKQAQAHEGQSMETLLLQVATRLASLEEQVFRLCQQVKDVADAINKLRKKL